MEQHGEHKRDKAQLIFWSIIGICIGLVIGASTHDWVLSVVAGIAFGGGLAMFATKKGLDNSL